MKASRTPYALACQFQVKQSGIVVERLASSRGPTRFQIMYALAEISFQNTKQFSKHKISFQNTKSVFKTQISFQNTNPVLKTQITAQIHKISFQIVNTFNYKSVKHRFLSVMSSLFNALLKFIICRRVFKQFTI